MYRLLTTAIVVLLFLVTPLFAQQIKIDVKNHVANRGAGYCAHCCVETVLRHYGYTNVAGHVDAIHARYGTYGGHMREDETCALLHSFGARYSYIPPASFRYDWLAWACENDCTCILNIRQMNGQSIGHAVVLVGYYEDKLAIIDSNRAGTVCWLTRAEFAFRWYGSMIMVYPK